MVAFNSRDRAAFDRHWAKLLADDTLLKKTVVVDGRIAGNIGSWTSEGKREIGYWIDRAFWGRGVATEALSAFLSIEDTRPLHAGVAKHNAASIRVLQKCGFALASRVAEDDSYIFLTLPVDSDTRRCARPLPRYRRQKSWAPPSNSTASTRSERLAEDLLEKALLISRLPSIALAFRDFGCRFSATIGG